MFEMSIIFTQWIGRLLCVFVCVLHRRKMTWREPSVCFCRQTDWAVDSLSHPLTSCLETPNSTWLLWLISSTSTQLWPNLSIRTLTGVFWRVSAHLSLSVIINHTIEVLSHTHNDSRKWVTLTLTSPKISCGLMEGTRRTFFRIWSILAARDWKGGPTWAISWSSNTIRPYAHMTLRHLVVDLMVSPLYKPFKKWMSKAILNLFSVEVQSWKMRVNDGQMLWITCCWSSE